MPAPGGFEMSGRSLEELEAERREINAQLAGTSRRLTQGRGSLRSSKNTASKVWHLAPKARRVALVIYSLTDYTAEPAAQYVVAYARKRRWPPKSPDELCALVEDCFLHTDVGELAALADTSAPADPAVMSTAIPFVQEWRLVGWTRNLNYNKGVAPNTEAVLLRLEQDRLVILEGVRPAPRGCVQQARARVWARRWRRRWGARYGSLRVRETIPVADMQSKASKNVAVVGWFPHP